MIAHQRLVYTNKQNVYAHVYRCTHTHILPQARSNVCHVKHLQAAFVLELEKETEL